MVAVEYKDNKPSRIEAVVIAAQHTEEATQKEIEEGITKEVIHQVIPKNLIDDETKIYINRTGRFVVGGPHGDSGLTGRKIIVDTYGQHSHGGGAFSGKDPSKVDRSASYAARYIAKNVVAAELADECEIQISYCIGEPNPLSINIECFNTEKVHIDKIREAVMRVFDFRPGIIVEELNLKRPIYLKTACYGHFGRNLPEFTWEKTDRVEELKRIVSEL